MKRKYRRSIPLSRERQFYVSGVCLDYKHQPEEMREKIRRLCREACPQNEEAFLRYITNEEPATKAMLDAYIASGTTLYRATKKFYILFDESGG